MIYQFNICVVHVNELGFINIKVVTIYINYVQCPI